MAVVHALARKSRNLNFGQERQQRIALLDPDFSRRRCRRRCRIVRSLLSCFNRRCLWHCCRRLPVFGRRAVVTVSLVVLCMFALHSFAYSCLCRSFSCYFLYRGHLCLPHSIESFPSFWNKTKQEVPAQKQILHEKKMPGKRDSALTKELGTIYKVYMGDSLLPW